MAAMVVVFQTLGVEAKDPSLYPSCHSGSSLLPPLPPLLLILMLLLVSMLVLRELELTPEFWQPLPYKREHPENNMFPSLFCGVYRCRPSSPIFGEQRHHT